MSGDAAASSSNGQKVDFCIMLHEADDRTETFSSSAGMAVYMHRQHSNFQRVNATCFPHLLPCVFLCVVLTELVACALSVMSSQYVSVVVLVGQLNASVLLSDVSSMCHSN